MYLQRGGGAFAPPPRYQTSASVGLRVSDIDGDGRPEVITAGFGTNEVGILPGLASGSFGPAVRYATGANSSPMSVAVGDVDGNGQPDIVVENYGVAKIGVLLSLRPSLYASGPAIAAATGSSLSLRGTNLTGATAVTFTSTTNVVMAVPSASFTSTNYTVAPNTITLLVPSTLPDGAYTAAVVTPKGTTNGFCLTVGSALALLPGSLQDERIRLALVPAHTTTNLFIPAMPGVTAVTLCLRDALGRTISTQRLALPATGLYHELNLRDQAAPGLYLLQVQAGATQVLRRLLVD